MMSLCQRAVFHESVAQSMAEVNRLINEQAYPQASDTLLKLLEESPAEPAYLGTLGKLLLDHSHNSDKAKELLELALNEAPNDATLQYDYARACIASNHPTEALGLLTRLIEAEQYQAESYPLLASLLEAQGYIAEAASAYLAWYTYDATVLQPVFELVGLYQRHNAPEQALETIETALAQHEANAQLWFLKGATLQALEKEQDSQAAFKQALTLAGEDMEIHWQLANWYRHSGKPNEAIQHLVEFLQHAPENIAALEALASTLHSMHRPNEALAVLQRLLSLQPNHTMALLLAGSLASSLGQVEQARTLFDTAQTALEAAGTPAEGLALRKVLTLPSILTNTAEAQALLDQTLVSLKALALYPPSIQDPLIEVAEAPFMLPFLHDGSDLPWMRQLQQALSKVALLPESSTTREIQQTQRTQRSKPLIALISPYWQAGHATAWMLQPWLNGIDRSRFDVAWVSLEKPAEATAGLSFAEGDQFITLTTNNWQQVQHQLSSLAFDVAIVPDTGQDAILTQLIRLPQLASHIIQVPLLWPSTLALNGSQHHTWLWPELQEDARVNTAGSVELNQQFSEQTHRFERLPLAPLRLLGEQPKRFREDFGLTPDELFLYLPASLHKLHPTMDATLLQLLEALPQAHLFIHEAPHTSWTQTVQARLEQQATQHNQTHLLKRITWLPLMDTAMTLATFKLADAVLDTFPVCDTGNLFKALSYGTPVVTVAGGYYKQQTTAIALQHLGALGQTAIAPTADALPETLSRVLAPLLAVQSHTEHATESVEKTQARQGLRQQWLEGTRGLFGSASHADSIEQLNTVLKHLLA